MAIKSYKPTTPGRRGMTVTDYSELSKVAPCKSLLEPIKKNSGRNSYGRITVRHRGGGVQLSTIQTVQHLLHLSSMKTARKDISSHLTVFQ